MDLKQSVFQIKILHGALFGGVLIFVGICIVIHTVMGMGDSLDVLPEQALYVIILIAGTMLYLSNYLYRRNAGHIESELSLENKLNRYRGAVIFRAALIETAGLIIGIGYLLTGDMLYLLLLTVPLAWFLVTFPKNKDLIKLLNLTYAEQQELGDVS